MSNNHPFSPHDTLSVPAMTGGVGPWLVLAVDGEPDVHTVIRQALARLSYRERPLTLLSCATAADAVRMLSEIPDIAVVLLNMAMNMPDAGLGLVRSIREEMGNHTVRIILRTGHGQAPEEEDVLAYDIEDYRSNAELTARRLFTCVVSALRAYTDIRALDTSRRGVRRIVQSPDPLDQASFAADMLTQLADTLNVTPDGVLCARRGGADGPLTVLAGAGRHAETADHPQPALGSATLDAVAEALRLKRAIHGAEASTLYMRVPDGPDEHEMAAWIHTGRPLDEVERGLAELLASKATFGFAAIGLRDQLRAANETAEKRVATRIRALEEANARLNRLATLDPLTGVWNRRRFLELAEAELGRARRYGRHLGVFLIDLDDFKAVNDTHGQAVGDEVLRAVVKRTREVLRASDHMARFGGEEFVVLLPETDGEGTAIVAERVRASLAQTPVVVDGRAVPITACLGVASWLQAEPSIERTLRRADIALHAAKQAGRNRVERAED